MESTVSDTLATLAKSKEQEANILLRPFSCACFANGCFQNY